MSKRSRWVRAAVAAALCAFSAVGGDRVWDATKSGRLMTATNETVLFKGVKLADVRLAKCGFNKAGRVRADGTRAMSQGDGTVCHARRLDDGRTLEAQCQLFDCGYTKCVKLRLSQRGDDVTGRILYAKYCTKQRGFSDVVGADFDVLDNTAPQPAYSVLPNGRVTNGYNVDWLALREVGSAEDNIPDASSGVMPTDKVTAWMENAVDPDAWTKWRTAHPASFHLFGEDRQYAVRNNIVPAHWLAKGNHAAERFHGVAQPGEFYPFQVCVASEKARTLRWHAKTGLMVSRITPETCAVAAKGVKPIWVMVDIPKDAAGKTLKGEVCVEDAADAARASIPFEIEVKGDVLEDGGIGDAWRLARLKWLNSDIGREDTVTKPYESVVVDKARRAVKILGRELVLGEDGLPAQIVSYFSGSNARIVEKGMNLLAAPVKFKSCFKSCCSTLAVSGGGETTSVQQQEFAFTEITPAHAAWRAEAKIAGGITRIVEGRIDFAGACQFRIRHVGGKVPRASFEVAMPTNVARFREGFGINGGVFPEGKVEQKWDANLNRDALWMGSINGGIVVRFKGANYRRPLINAYYAWQKLKMPESWASGGGVMSLEKAADVATIRAVGKDAPEGAEWNFDLYITPFHKLDMKTHLGDRYWHLSQRRSELDTKKIRAAGATVVNLHHNTIWNPYINYPYNDDSGPLLKKAVKDAHAAGLLLKVYYTTRELTQNLPEFFALKSLDGEALLTRDASVPGWPCTNRGGPHPWLREHVGLDILPAWRENVRFPQAYPPRLDLAVITTPDTRWDNFYLEGLDYLVREYGIDGLYIDDTALTGESMQRARRILDRDGKRRLVDNHSWNHHDPRAGSGNTNLAFIDLYPYFDLLWRGEGFYNNTPSDFWLIERSGIAFGIAGEMLGRGNPFRGLLFGMTDRAGWGGGPSGLWKFFDAVNLGDMELIGWWDDACPVKVSGSDDVKASVWKGDGRAVVVVANFAQKPRTASFAIDSARLGLDGGKAVWQMPAIGGVQNAGQAPDMSKPVEIPGGGGFILTARAATGLGFPKAGDEAAKTIRADFKAPPPGYGEVPFWWWSGRDPLNKERLLEQIEEIHKAGIAGVQVNYSHYRSGAWPTQDTTPALFTDEWWDFFSFAAQECGKRGMGISLSNYTLDFPDAENLWRKLKICTPEMYATELSYVNGKIVKRKVPRTYNPLHPEAGKRVVERFFNPFMEKVPEHLRGGLNYFFQDELVLTRDILWLWSDDLPAEFKKRKGYDLEPMLPALFGDHGPDTAKVRLDMNDVMSALACERYYKPIYDWHASRGLIYGCDQATRGRHPMNKYIDYMRVMKYFTAPGFDTPGRSADLIKNKVGSSIAHLYNRPRVWLEGYHSQGWQASTTTIFDSTCHNYLYGSNLLNLHGLYYSTYGGWWEWAPPCYHFRMPYWTYMKTFLKYFERLSYVLSQGVHVCDVAVVNPLEPCVYNRNRGNVSVGVAHDIVRRLVTEAQTDVDFIDADSLARAEAKDGRLCVAGEAYRVVVVPDMVAIKRSSLEKLVSFKRAGGKVVVLGAKPQFTDAPHTEKAKIDALVAELTVAFPAKPSAEQLKAIAVSVGTPDFRAPGAAKALHRRVGGYDVYFICDLKETGDCTFRATGTPELWNPWDGTQKTLTDFRHNGDGTTTVKIAGDGAPRLIVFVNDGGRGATALPRAATSAAPPASDESAGRARIPAAPQNAFTLDGEWDFTLKPTLDNKWGDFRLPVRERYIGAEIRRVKMVGAETLNLPAEMTVGFGPQFLDGNGSPFLFSWREGVEGKPGFQNWHHGLNGIVGDDFFVLGPYNMRLYDVAPSRGAKPGAAYKTFVYAPCTCKAKPVAHGVEPKTITLDGKSCKVGEEIALAAGYHELAVSYDKFGRAALVMMRTDVTSEPSKVPLSMCWYNDPAVLPFDPFGGKIKEGVYTATLPPACEAIEITLRGTLLSANIAGADAEVTLVDDGGRNGRARSPSAPHEKNYRVKPRLANAGVAALTLKVAHEPGFIGGAAFTEPMRLTCGKGKIALGNWALIADGLRFYSGGAIYEKDFTLTKAQAAASATLDLGRVGACCGVSVNGGAEKVLCCPPWRVEIDGLKEGANTVKVTVYNTLNNHYQTIPTRYRTTVENEPSGLIGPVRLDFARE